MLINEVIKTKVHPFTPADDTKSRGDFETLDPEAIGQGGYAKVIPDPNDPHMVIRQEYDFTDPLRNGFHQWALVIKKEAASNPYLPRIYEIKGEYVRKGSAVLSRFDYTIERLVQGENLNRKQIVAIGESIFTNFEKEISHMYGSTWQSLPPSFLWMKTITALRVYMYDNQFDKIRDPKLIEAFQLMSKASEQLEGKPFLDLFDDNFMARLYPSLHLVITDPLSTSPGDY